MYKRVYLLFLIPFLIFTSEYGYSQENYNEYTDYYDFFRDPLVKAGMKHRFFETGLTLDKKNGDLTLFVRGKTDERVELSLTYNFKEEPFYDKLFGWEKGISDGKPKFLKFLNPDQPVPRPDILAMSKEELTAHFERIANNVYRYVPPENRPKPSPKQGTIQLKKGDMFSSTCKIWEMKIWEQLVNALEEDKTRIFEIDFRFILKVADQFYSSMARFEIDYKTVRLMKSLKTTYEKKAVTEPEEKKDPDIIFSSDMIKNETKKDEGKK